MNRCSNPGSRTLDAPWYCSSCRVSDTGGCGKVQGTIADTREDAVECAAFLATAKAFARLNDTTILFDDRWIVTPR
jgi:hypothetical protein